MINLDFFAVIGFIGQGLFSMRFIIQWIASEKAGRSVIPFSFWIFSLGGSVLLLTYAIYRKDPVFILGQAPNVLIYSRNIYLLKKGRATEEGDMIEN
ncbi:MULTISPECIES: lipid-A-disaccharide synthase N-terminal domain-containing protein [Fusobacterium]|uniref:lipid-A-disaccharide synthase N-terminal domain-containing protein n=1 Tax=Fusobacterium TaxID=848 RepID=UPI001F32B409|nr:MULTISPECIES: lipid-A-disaccharide synthase N-terminal domain-containing protein [Fusobacterium]MCF2613078.1 lipid-A-disaccharide synthase N-terminal domain-containing protein [Fusobacterium perfoetens]MDY2981220.1 lipid-A-disaccharide synthase N-terminal domain-containing protein [Fusobacterium sp.]